MIRVMRYVVCGLSLVLLGALGEGLINVQHFWMSGKVVDFPVMVKSVLAYYPLNAGVFALTLSPFMILIFALAVFSSVSEALGRLFWHLFVALWLLVGLYFTAFVLVLIMPFYVGMTEMGRMPLRTLIWWVDGVLIATMGGALLIIATRRFRVRDENRPTA